MAQTEDIISGEEPHTIYGSGNVMIWGYFAATGPQQLALIKSTMNSASHQSVNDKAWG